MPTPPRTEGYKRKPVFPEKIIPHPQEMDKFEEQEMTKSSPAENEWYDNHTRVEMSFNS